MFSFWYLYRLCVFDREVLGVNFLFHFWEKLCGDFSEKFLCVGFAELIALRYLRFFKTGLTSGRLIPLISEIVYSDSSLTHKGGVKM